MTSPRFTSSVSHRATRSAGFTFPELVLGILITSMIGLSCAAVAMAVSTGWKQADEASADYMVKGRTALYVQSLVRGSRLLGYCRSGSLESPSDSTGASIIFWRADLNNDQLIQLKEIGLLEHSASTGKLMYYQATFPSAGIEAVSNTIYPDTFLSTSTAAQTFKAISFVSGRTVGAHVSGARFDAINTSSATQRPSIEFLLKLRKGSAATTYEYGSATLRPGK